MLIIVLNPAEFAEVLLNVDAPFFVNVPAFVKVFAPVPANVPVPATVNVPLLVNVTPLNVTVFPFKSSVNVFPDGIVGATVSVKLATNGLIVLPLDAFANAVERFS